jgi:phosphohistidine phosphatase SixA
MGIRFVFFVAVVFIFSCSSEVDHSKIIFVRHAEKDALDSGSNPKLTPQGVERAKKLRSVLDTLPISTIFSTSYDRNIQTVMPLAAQNGIDIQLYERDSWSSLLDTLPSSFAGESVLICGHGDQIFEMIKFLGGQTERKQLEKNEYDKIFILKEIQREPKLEIIRF